VPITEPIQHHQPRSTFSTWLGIVLLFAVFGMIAFVMMKASARGDTYEKKRAKVRAEKLEAAQKENLTALTTYGWVDKNKGVVRIPVDQAMKLTLAELADKKPTVGEPIVVASPAAAPQTSAAPNASTSAAPNASTSPAASAAGSPAAKGSATPAADISTTPKPKAVEGHDSEAHNQPAAAMNPPPAPPNTQPGPNANPAASVPSHSAKAPGTPSPSAAPSAPGTPLPVPGKTP
jgi:type II secretory pathway pseudopilin PulG